MKILILGATGFIGAAVARKLAAEGHSVTGLGRSPQRARNQLKDLKWLQADLNDLTQATDWTPLIRGQDVVVNCAGALQDGLHDDLAASQSRAMIALYDAAKTAGIRLVVQISANTSGAGAETAFFTTKRRADQALAISGVPYVILRPTLVLGRNAFGGTALLRALAALPGLIPLAHADNTVATVSLDDVADCVAKSLSGEIAANGDYDLAAGHILKFRELVALHRAWLGLGPVRIVAVSSMLARPVSLLADLAGRLGWRSPLRSTAMAVMAGGVSARTEMALPAGMHFQTAEQTLAAHPAGVQDLWFARLYLAKPLVFAMLAIFWLVSGVVPLFDPPRASAFLEPFMPDAAAMTLTFVTCAIDIGLGLGVLFRPWSRGALIGMLLVSITYLAFGSLLTPALWLDPLGPFVKVLPSMALALVGLTILDER